MTQESRREVFSGIVGNVAAGLAAARSLGRRLITGNLWSEQVIEEPTAGPKVEMTEDVAVQRPADAVGPLNHRRYHVRIANSKMSPADLIEIFRTDPNRLSPTSFAVFEPAPDDEPMVVGDRFTVHLPGPWDGPVVVTHAEPDRVRLETRDGHLEAGWIEFTARQEGANVVFQIESLARSGDQTIDKLYHWIKIAKLTQTHMWVKVLEAVVRCSGGVAVGRPSVETTIYQGRA